MVRSAVSTTKLSYLARTLRFLLHVFGLMLARRDRRLRGSTLISPSQFRRELMRERIRSTRRSFPFCVIEIRLKDSSGASRRSRKADRLTVEKVLNRSTRLTDHKCEQTPGNFLWLLTDTSEMGGRSALDRITDLLHQRGLKIHHHLEVHDQDGFGHDEPSRFIGDAGGDRRRPEDPSSTTLDAGHHQSMERFDEPSSIAPTLTSSASSVRSGPKSLSSFDQDSDGGTVVLKRSQQVSVETTTMPSMRRAAHASSVGTVTLTRQTDRTVADWTTLQVSPIDLGDGYLTRSKASVATKRCLDVVGGVVGLAIFSPLMAAAIVAIRMGDGQPALFRQTREGRGGKPFTIYKLRTMTVDAESRQADLVSHSHRDGPAFKIEADPRITPVGSWLRKTCVDELPQLYNVLRGDMSLVGPRPLPWHESRACSRWHRRRLEVRPGMTCYWQVDKRSAETFDQWMRLDLMYLRKGNLVEDLRLIFRTIWVPLFGRGGE